MLNYRCLECDPEHMHAINMHHSPNFGDTSHDMGLGFNDNSLNESNLSRVLIEDENA